MNQLMRRFGEWSEYWDETSQHCFYYNHRTEERRWDPPENLEDAMDGPVAAVSSDDEGDDVDKDDDDVDSSDSDNDNKPVVQARRQAASEGSARVGAGGGAGGGAGAGAGAGNTATSTSPRVADTTWKVTMTMPASELDKAFRKKRFRLLWAARVANAR